MKLTSGYNKVYISQVLNFSEQNRTHNNEFELDKFRFRKELAGAVACKVAQGGGGGCDRPPITPTLQQLSAAS